MKIPKIANYRPIVLSAIALMIGITIGALCINSLVAFGIVLGILALFSAVTIIVKKSPLIVISIFLLIGFSLMSLYSSLVTPKEINVENCYVECRVTEILSDSYGENRYVVEDLTFEEERYSSKGLLKSERQFEIGDKVVLIGGVETIEYKPFNSYSTARYAKGIKYEINGEQGAVIEDTKLRWYEWVRYKLRKCYVDRLGDEDAGIALGLVIGDVSYVSHETNEEMRATGVSHIFSVSGLHVGFMCALIYALFRLFKVNKRKSLIVVIAVLLGYGILTGFPVGVVRASIMSIVVLISLLLIERNDPLNTLSFTAIVILLISPIELFSVSFLLSIGAVLGITCFYDPLKNLCKWENKILRRVWFSVAMSISAHAFIIPISANFFGTMTLYFIVANLLIVPLSSIIYMLLIPLSVLTIIWEPLGILISPLSFPLMGIRIVGSLIANLPFAVLDLKFPIVAGVLYTVGTLVLSRFYMGSKKSKIALACASFCACALIIFIF